MPDEPEPMKGYEMLRTMPSDDEGSEWRSQSSGISRHRRGPKQPAKRPRTWAQMRSSFHAGKFVIVPRGNLCLFVWDSFMILLIMLMAFRVPFETSFGAEPVSSWVDPFFLVDLCLQFFMAIPDTTEQRWVYQPRAIISKYWRSMFIVDFLSTVPVQLARFVFLGKQFSPLCTSCLRMLKILRLLRMKRIIQRHQGGFDIPMVKLRAIRLVTRIVLTFHWVACSAGMMHQIQMYANLEGGSWVDALRDLKPGMFDDDSSVEDEPLAMYRAALYWSVMTVTSVGYGDITAANSLEAVCMTFIMALMGAFWANTIGSLCSLLSYMDSDISSVEVELDMVNRMLSSLTVPDDLDVKSREFLIMKSAAASRQTQLRVFNDLSPGLKGKMALATMQPLFQAFPFLKPVRTKGDYVVQMFLSTHTAVYPPQELITEQSSLKLVCRGKVLLGGVVIHPNKGWGVDELLVREKSLHGRSRGLAITFAELQHLSQSSLQHLLSRFPEQKGDILRMKMIILLRRAMVYGQIVPSDNIEGIKSVKLSSAFTDLAA